MPTHDDLARQYLPLVRWLVQRYGRGLDPDDAESDGCLALVECLRRLDPARLAGFKSFVGWRVRRRMVDLLRKNSKRITRHLVSDPLDNAGPVESELRHDFEEALQVVPNRFRHLMRLLCWEGWRPIDVARMEGVNRSQVNRWIRQMREAI